VKELGQVRSHHVPKIFPARLLFFFCSQSTPRICCNTM